MKFLNFTLCLLLFISCTNNLEVVSEIYTTNSCDENFQSISFSNLVDSVSKYNGRGVEVSGYYHWAPDASAISLHRGDIKLQNMLWVDFDSELAKKTNDDTIFLFKSKRFDKVKERKIKIRGRVDAGNNRYHYVARIENVCYLEVLE